MDEPIGADAALALRSDFEDAFLRNELSAQRLASLVQKSARCGLPHFSKLQRISSSKKKVLKRNFLKHFKKRSAWVPLFYAKVPLSDGAEHQLPFLLPHLLVHKMAQKKANWEDFKPHNEDDAHVVQALMETGKELQMDWHSAVPLGLHGDGTPYGRSKKDSLEVFSMNFLCARQEQIAKLRIPLFIINKRHMEKEKTKTRVLQVLAWSFTCLAVGVVLDFEGGGGTKECPVGTQLPVAYLVQLRADWAFLKQMYGIPQFNEVAGICHMCEAHPGNWRAVGLDAEWRQKRLSPMGFHKKQLEQGLMPCPIFSIPGVSAKSIFLDWLHCADAGVACDIAGNIFCDVLPFLHSSRQKGIEQLWALLLQWYKDNGITDRIDKLKAEHFLVSGKPPKLKCKAAACRQLVPFLPFLCDACFQEGDPKCKMYHKTIKQLAAKLNQCYQTLHEWNPEILATTCRESCILMVALEDYAQLTCPGTLRWRCKPKLHVWQELCEYQCFTKGNPKLFWCYKDEDFGGHTVKLGERRGGKNTAKSVAENIFLRFFALTGIPV